MSLKAPQAILFLLLMPALLVAALPAHGEDDKKVSREREALKRTQQALRQSEEQRAALPASKRLAEDLERIRLAAKANNVKWLGNGPPGATPQQEIDQGRRMGPAGTEDRVQADRLYTKRKMPY